MVRVWIVIALSMAIPIGMRAQEGEVFDLSSLGVRVVNGLSFDPDGQTVYGACLCGETLGRTGPGATPPELVLFSARLTDTGLVEPIALPFSGQYDDYEPALSPDGRAMVFNSKRPYADGRIPERNDLWFVERDEVGWGTPRKIHEVTTFDDEESYATFTSSGRLIFISYRQLSDDVATSNLLETQLHEGRFSQPVVSTVSTQEYGEGDPFVAADGSFLIFTRWDLERPWVETVDLYIAFDDNGRWTTPVPMDPLNTEGPDYAPAVSADGRWLFYRANSRMHRVRLEPVLESLRHR